RLGTLAANRAANAKPAWPLTPYDKRAWPQFIFRSAVFPAAGALYRGVVVPLDIYLNVAVGGVLTGLVYGLMALGLSVIFGVVRVVNFAHGEMMTIAMYIALTLFTVFHLDPLVMLVPVAAVLFALGYALQAGLINIFITGPDQSQSLLLIAIAIIIVNMLLIIFGPDSQMVQTAYANETFKFGELIVDATKLYAASTAIVVAGALFGFFRYT